MKFAPFWIVVEVWAAVMVSTNARKTQRSRSSRSGRERLPAMRGLRWRRLGSVVFRAGRVGRPVKLDIDSDRSFCQRTMRRLSAVGRLASAGSCKIKIAIDLAKLFAACVAIDDF